MHKLIPIRAALVLAVVVAACGGAEVAPAIDEVAAVTEPDSHEDATGADPSGVATEADAGELVVRGVWSRMSPRRAGVAAIYLEIDNRTGSDDAVIGAAVPREVAGRVELHETYEVGEEAMDPPASMEGGHANGGEAGEGDMGGHGSEVPMMAMREVPSIELPDAATTTLEPGGLHLMLFDLVEDLAPGDAFELTLEFERSVPVVVAVEVRAHAGG